MFESFFASVLRFATEYNEHFSTGMAYLGAGIAMIAGFGPAIGQGFAAGKAAEAGHHASDAGCRRDDRALLASDRNPAARKVRHTEYNTVKEVLE